MLKISRIARHNTVNMGGCSRMSENRCGIMWRAG